MFNAMTYVIDAFVSRIHEGYTSTFSSMEPSYPGIIEWAGRMALERISNTDCLYHNVEHTILVSLVGQQILRGKHMQERSVTPLDWLHVMISLLCHDIGYVRGICQNDQRGRYVSDNKGNFINAPRGVSDAYLTEWHVDRSQVFVQERFGNHRVINADTICTNIERTRFPSPNTAEYQSTTDLPGLVRAADLVGQLADPMYLCKVGALYYEFVETGANERLGYKSPADLSEGYPQFYWKVVAKFIEPALNYLRMTHEGKQWVANLQAHIFAAEHQEPVLGPELSGK